MGFVVAIDGPAGTGKGTIAKVLAEELGYITIDTGAMYRSVTLEMIRRGVTLLEKERIQEILETIQIDLKMEEKEQRVYLNGEDVTKFIRTKEVTEFVSPVSGLIPVRVRMVDLQRRLAEGKNVVMEGRDIGTYVFPDADVKIYLEADIEERTKRRMKQNEEKNIQMSYEEVKENIRKRDENDKNKEIGALKIAEDAHVIDTTHLSIEEVKDQVLKIIKETYQKRGEQAK